MKYCFHKVFFSFIVFQIAFGGSVFSQPYQSLFGTYQTSWNTKQSGFSQDYTDSIVVTGDTLIQNDIYKVLNLYSYFSSNPIFMVDYTGYLYEDTLTGKVWYFSSADTNKTLIMDLSLQITDSFKIYNSYYFIDSIYFAAGRKHIRMNYFIPSLNEEKFLMIEGVGTNIGVKYADMDWPGLNTYLLCQYKNEKKNYQNSHPEYSMRCNLIDGVYIRENPKFKVEVFPNPAGDFINIKYDLPAQSINRKLKLYNNLGQLIVEYILSAEKDFIKIASPEFSGIYFYSLYEIENQKYTGKILILK